MAPAGGGIFFISVPIGLAALTLSPVPLRESRGSLARRSYDPAGALTITGALVLLVYAVRPLRSPAQDYLAADNSANPLVVLTEGYRAAFLACAVLAGIGLALALLLPGRPPKAARELPAPVLATSAGG